MIYVGKHQTTNPEDRYFGSGKYLKDAIKKYGKKHFKKEVLHVFDNEEDMNAKERELITEEFVSRTDTYNLGIGGEGGAQFKGRKHTEETKRKIREARSKQILSKESIQKMANSLRGRKQTKEHIENVVRSKMRNKLKQIGQVS